MNLYLLSQNVKVGYDTYESCIVCADDEDDAANITPGSNWGETWCHSPGQVAVEFLGVAAEGIKRGVILASFNAG